MNSEQKKSVIRIGIILAVIAAVILAVVLIKREKPDQILKGQTYERVSYDAIGTAAAATTTNSLYDGNSRTLLSGGLENIHLDVQYTPASEDSVLFILLEGSNDDGDTFFPMGTKSVGTTDIKFYSEGASSTQGIPIVFPGDSTSVSGTLLTAMMDFDMVADHVRIRVKESTTSTKGTVYIRTTLTSKR